MLGSDMVTGMSGGGGGAGVLELILSMSSSSDTLYVGLNAVRDGISHGTL